MVKGTGSSIKPYRQPFDHFFTLFDPYRVHGVGKKAGKTFGIPRRSVSEALTLMRQSLSITEADSTSVFPAISRSGRTAMFTAV
jgi:hypothetical protein